MISLVPDGTMIKGMQFVEARIDVPDSATHELESAGFYALGSVLSSERKGLEMLADKVNELTAAGTLVDAHRGEEADWVLGVAYQFMFIRSISRLARAPVALMQSVAIARGASADATATDGRAFAGCEMGEAVTGAMTVVIALHNTPRALVLGAPASRALSLKAGHAVVVDARTPMRLGAAGEGAPCGALILRFAPVGFARAFADVHCLRDWCAPAAARAGAVSLPWPYVRAELPWPWDVHGANSLRGTIYAVALAMHMRDVSEADELAALQAEHAALADADRLVLSACVPAEIRAFGPAGRLRQALLSKGPLVEVVDGVAQLRDAEGLVLRADARGLFPPIDGPTPLFSPPPRIAPKASAPKGTKPAAQQCANTAKTDATGARVGCRAVGAQRCASCGVVVYCGRDCQLAHWKAGHKKECQQVKAKTVVPV